jgi:hypothetical protein
MHQALEVWGIVSAALIGFGVIYGMIFIVGDYFKTRHETRRMWEYFNPHDYSELSERLTQLEERLASRKKQ